MTTLAAIRTHRWGEDEERLAAQLAPVFGDRLVVVFHGRPADLSLPLPVVDIDDAWVSGQGLRALSDWGWRCGDYFLYALRAARPDADRYWLIEPDVWFSGPVERFFAETDALDHDLLGARVTDMTADHRFARGLPDIAHLRAIFALTRFSGRAIDRLADLRRAYCAGPELNRFFTNDEIFCFSHAAADPDLTVGSLHALLPEWLGPDTMRTDPDILFDAVAGVSRPGVHHPVRGRLSFLAALGRRLAGDAAYLRAMAPSLAHLTDREIARAGREAGRLHARQMAEAAALGRRKAGERG